MTTTPSLTQSSNRRLPAEFYQLTDPDAGVQLPPHHRVDLRLLDNRELDKLVSQLGRNKTTWRRALLLHEWLVEAGHIPDDRLCTTVGIRTLALGTAHSRDNAFSRHQWTSHLTSPLPHFLRAVLGGWALTRSQVFELRLSSHVHHLRRTLQISMRCVL